MRFFLLAAAILFSGCSSSEIIDSGRIIRDLKSARTSISRDRNYLNYLNERKAGKSGFYYVIDRGGVVVHHPVASLVGTSFRKFEFTEAILKNTSGCLKYIFGSMSHLIFFESLNESEIICLSIPGDEVTGSEGVCRLFMEKK